MGQLLQVNEHNLLLFQVRKVVVYDKHPEGVAQVFFSSALEADAAIAAVDGRMFFNGNVMKASTWDGKTKYKVSENNFVESSFFLFRNNLHQW